MTSSREECIQLLGAGGPRHSPPSASQAPGSVSQLSRNMEQLTRALIVETRINPI